MNTGIIKKAVEFLTKLLLTLSILAGLLYIGQFLFFEHMFKGTLAKQNLALLSSVRSALKVYYMDNDGQYPQSLDVLINDPKYGLHGLHGTGLFAEDGTGHIGRVHGRNNRQLKMYYSRSQAEDSGGWGYIADPSSPERGAFFINCTHPYFGMRYAPWSSL